MRRIIRFNPVIRRDKDSFERLINTKPTKSAGFGEIFTEKNMLEEIYLRDTQLSARKVSR